MPESFAGITVPDGEPAGLRAAARQFNAFALEIDSCAGRVQSLPGQLADWRGPASARFAGAAQQHADAAGGAVTRCRPRGRPRATTPRRSTRRRTMRAGRSTTRATRRTGSRSSSR